MGAADLSSITTTVAERGAAAYLRLADRLLPAPGGRVLPRPLGRAGQLRPGRSDIDFVGVVDGEVDASDLRRLRALHLIAGARSGISSAGRGWSPTANTCNGAFVRRDDLVKPVSEIVPIASHTGRRFTVGAGPDVNPVIWKELAEHGVAVRGTPPDALGLSPESTLLRDWCLGNLSSYWSRWAEAAVEGRAHSGWLRPGWATAWATLGSPKLHRTVATGDVLSKEETGEYALDVFDDRWHPLIRDGLAYRRGQPIERPHPRRSTISAAGMFVKEVIRSAHAL